MNKAMQSKGAVFSDCRSYRYYLWRIWDTSKPIVLFIGLNPSRADERENDNTIKRVIGIAENWGAGGIYMANLFAVITPYPEELAECEDPVKDNDQYLRHVAQLCDKVVFAWGNFKVQGRDQLVMKMFPAAYCLYRNKNGSPKHPLYVKKDALPFKFIP